MRILLASASPRRKELLRFLFDHYEVIPADIDEVVPEGTPPERVGERIAEEKTRAVWVQHPDALVIGADTVVVVGGEVLGKPRDVADAKRSGRPMGRTNNRIYTVYKNRVLSS